MVPLFLSGRGVKMAKVRGRYLRLSLARRMIGDFLALSQPIPLAHGERRIDIRPLKTAVEAMRPRPSWLALFFKAYAIVAASRPVLRRLYVRRPWPHLYEHPENVGSVVVSRSLEGDKALFLLPIVAPERRAITDIEALLKAAQHKPIAEIPAFRRQLRLARLPALLRGLVYSLGMDWAPKQRARVLGTFGLSVVAGMGMATLTTHVPWTTMIHYTPFDDAGSMFLRIAIDHRVLDGVEVAFALHKMENVLNSVILDELRQMPRAKAA